MRFIFETKTKRNGVELFQGSNFTRSIRTYTNDAQKEWKVTKTMRTQSRNVTQTMLTQIGNVT